MKQITKKTARIRAVFFLCISTRAAGRLSFVFFHDVTHQDHDVPDFLLVHVGIGLA